MNDGNPLAVSPTENLHGLRRQGDLRYHHDDRLPERERAVDEAHDDLCLPATRDAVQKGGAGGVLAKKFFCRPIGSLLCVAEQDLCGVPLLCQSRIRVADLLLRIHAEDPLLRQSGKVCRRNGGERTQKFAVRLADRQKIFENPPLSFAPNARAPLGGEKGGYLFCGARERVTLPITDIGNLGHRPRRENGAHRLAERAKSIFLQKQTEPEHLLIERVAVVKNRLHGLCPRAFGRVLDFQNHAETRMICRTERHTHKRSRTDLFRERGRAKIVERTVKRVWGICQADLAIHSSPPFSDG